MTHDTSPKLIDGKTVSALLLKQAADLVAKIKATKGVTPCLATVLVGEDPASATYVKMKGKRCEEAGMKSLRIEMPAATTTQQLVDRIRQLSADPGVHGILLQHPTPHQIDERAAFEAIDPRKDVDGVTATCMGQMWLGMEGYGSCTPAGIMMLLKHYQVKLEGVDAVVIGRSPILGKPMAAMLVGQNATVTICHSRTRNLPEMVRRAEVVVAAVGKPEFVKGDWIRQGAVVMDAGYNPGNVGDVDFQGALPRARLITPVPGGVGPMTIATLIWQTALGAARGCGIGID